MSASSMAQNGPGPMPGELEHADSGEGSHAPRSSVYAPRRPGRGAASAPKLVAPGASVILPRASSAPVARDDKTLSAGVFLSGFARLGFRLLRSRSLGLALCPARAAAQSEPFPEPEALAPAPSRSGCACTSRSSTDGGFLHDARLMDVVYEHVRFDGRAHGRAPRGDRRRAPRSRWRDVLESLALRRPAAQRRASAESLQLFTSRARPRRRPRATTATPRTRMRFQLGQRDKFRDGLIRSGAYEAEMRAVFREQGLPEDLALPAARRVVVQRARVLEVRRGGSLAVHARHGPALHEGRLRDRRAARPDHRRRTPPRGSCARTTGCLGTWPLALTAYNHGAAGMSRAVKRLGTSRIERDRRPLREPQLRLRVAELLRAVPRGAAVSALLRVVLRTGRARRAERRRRGRAAVLRRRRATCEQQPRCVARD